MTMFDNTTNNIRKAFIDFFVKNGHNHIASSPLVPEKDPSLLFTNSGMVQFKNIFTGQEKAPASCAVTAQKCVRAGGKHNDLENVGYTARHHTFFEMLGNFSFGDYFKETAIELAWHFVTKDLGLPKERLYVTIYKEDFEAGKLWQKIAHLPPSHILPIDGSDNFWQMGETGPCGPCSEIFYDHGSDIPGGPPGSAEEDGDRFVEIWNLVFMQYERQEDGRLVELPQPSIDTGMGLERIAAVLQGKHNNYDIDLFSQIIKVIAELSGNASPQTVSSRRIIADHLRSCCFMLADGVFPSNEGRGYVLRRIMRRAIRHAHHLGVESPMIFRLVPTLIGLMGSHYRELQRGEKLISETWHMEEKRFQKTLERGLILLTEALETLPEGENLPGNIAFQLYDTYGFPLDLTCDILREKNLSVDVATFDQHMEEQRKKARKSWTGSGDSKEEASWFSLKERLGNSEFLGYDRKTNEALIVAQTNDKSQETPILEKGQKGVLLLNQTVFYAESGGQIGDCGLIIKSAGDKISIFRVDDTQKKAGSLLCHIGEVQSGSFHNGDSVALSINEEKHAALRRHHSVTHLLHAALRDVLGTHVTQKGSRISHDSLRFDFTHGSALSKEELHNIQALVNAKILANSPVVTRAMPLELAMDSGAMALFGEKYSAEVRVVSMGEVKNREDGFFSIELCGGTHTSHTGDIGTFLILSQSSVSAGIRRIEASAGYATLAHIQQSEALIDDISHLLKSPRSLLNHKIETLLIEKRRLEIDIKNKQKNILQQKDDDFVEKIGDIMTLLVILPETTPRDLKTILDQKKQKISNGVIALISPWQQKVSLIVGLTGDAAKKYDAVELVNVGATAIGGKGGGGRPDMAQAGGNNAKNMPMALENIKKHLQKRITPDALC